MADDGDEPNVVPIAKAREPSWMKKLHRTEGGATLPTLANALILFGNDPKFKGMFGYNAFTSRCVFRRAPPPAEDRGFEMPGPYPREMTEEDISLVQAYLQRAWSPKFMEGTVSNAIQVLARANAYHPVREYLDSLVWDGEYRLESWLTDHLGVADTPLHRVFASRWMIGLVARAFDPGCQMDTALILESRQGLRKSTALRVLGEPWFTDHVPDLSSKDALEQLQGVWIIELAELSSLNHAETHRIKSFVSTRIDRFRPSFGHFSADYPRQCGFAGTINPGSNGYLRDETGGRRFWIVACGVGWTERQQVDVEALRAVRDQLWAEAVQSYRDGNPWWLDSTELETEQEEAAELRQTDDPRERKVRQYVEALAWVRMDDILGSGCLDISVDRWTVRLRTEIGYIMSAMKWKRHRPRLKDGKREWRYYPAGQEPAPEPEDSTDIPFGETP